MLHAVFVRLPKMGMLGVQARVDELLWAQAQAAAVPVDAAQRLCIANLEVDLSEARSALAQVISILLLHVEKSFECQVRGCHAWRSTASLKTRWWQKKHAAPP